MSLQEVQDLCIEILAKGPDIAEADSWSNSTRPSGLVITYSSGARLWTALTTAGAIASDRARTDPAPAAPPVPALYDSAGKISPRRAELHLAAALMGGHTPEITSAYAYANPARHPGVGLFLADGSRAFLPFVSTAASGKNPARTPFTIDAAF